MLDIKSELGTQLPPKANTEKALPVKQAQSAETPIADSCDAAQAYRFDAARDSWMMPPTVTR